MWRINETNFHFRVFNKQFIGLDTNGNGIDIVAESNTPGSSETFEIVRNSNDLSRVRIKAPNGFFLQVTLKLLGVCHMLNYIQVEKHATKNRQGIIYFVNGVDKFYDLKL